MPVKQVMRWQTSDDQEFMNEDAAVEHEAYLMRRKDLKATLDRVWFRDVDMDDVIDALLADFIFTRKES